MADGPRDGGEALLESVIDRSDAFRTRFLLLRHPDRLNVAQRPQLEAIRGIARRQDGRSWLVAATYECSGMTSGVTGRLLPPVARLPRVGRLALDSRQLFAQIRCMFMTQFC